MPSRTSLDKVADYFGVSVAYLIGKSNYKNEAKAILREGQAKKGVTIPVLGEVIAGVPIEAIKDITNREEISKTMANSSDYFALSIKDDRMTPHITEGDIVIARQQYNAKTEEIVIAKING